MFLSRSAFLTGSRRLLSKGARFKPAVWQWEDGGRTLIVKDVSSCPFLYRGLARWLMGREKRILLKLAGLIGFPRFSGDLDRNAFAMTLQKGVPLNKDAFLKQPREYTDLFLALVKRMHECGIFHLDLRQRQNVLLDEVGHQVSIVDFGASFAPGFIGRFFLGWVFRWVDRNAPLKYLARWAPEHLTDTERRSVRRIQSLRRFWFVSKHAPDGEQDLKGH